MKNEFLQSKEGNAFVKLVLWLIFIGFLFFAFAFQKNDNTSKVKDNKEETKTFKNVEKMKNDLLQKSLNYEYVINENETTTIYNGTKCNDKEIWYKETSEGITKYLKESGKIYKVTLNEKEESSEEENSLGKLFDILKGFNFNETINGNIRNIEYNLDTIKVVIKTNLDNITSIMVIKDNVHYEMQFTNIGFCDNISSEN